jgi:ATP synthase I chain
MVDAAANLRRASIAAAVLGLVSVVVLSIVGHPLMGVFVCVGLAFGAGNNWALQRSVRSYGAGQTPPKGRFTSRVFLRLGAITLIAIGIALIVRPDGLGVFAGLAVFQIVMLLGAAIPVFRSLRPTS